MSESDDKKKKYLGSPGVYESIEHLGCVKTVDTMLLEGAKPVDVARFIQIDNKMLTGVSEATLANALSQRKKALQDAMESATSGYEEDGGTEDGDETLGDSDDWEGIRKSPNRVSAIANKVYERAQSGVQEILELEAIYLTSRERVDRALDLEHTKQIYIKDLSKDLASLGSLLVQMHRVKKDLGITTRSAKSITSNFKGLSEKTALTLGTPESRRKVIDIVDRLARRGQMKFDVGEIGGAPAAADGD